MVGDKNMLGVFVSLCIELITWAIDLTHRILVENEVMVANQMKQALG